jgi:hypothetical protein
MLPFNYRQLVTPLNVSPRGAAGANNQPPRRIETPTPFCAHIPGVCNESGGPACLKSLSVSCRTRLAGTGMVDLFVEDQCLRFR